MQSHQKLFLFSILFATFFGLFNASPNRDLVAKLKLLQDDAAFDERLNEIDNDSPLDNTLYIITDSSEDKGTTSTTTARIPMETTGLPTTSSDPDFESLERISDTLFRQSQARIAIASSLMNFMRGMMRQFF